MPRVLVLPGDGIGPEVVAAATRVLRAVRDDLELTERPVGLAAIDATGAPYEPDLVDVARRHDAVLLGAVGGAQRPDQPFEARPEAALFLLRQELDLYANLRPIRPFQGLLSRSPLREEHALGTDILLVRELTGGLYFGERGLTPTDAYDVATYTRAQIERIVRLAFALARRRRRRVASVDKANVLATGTLWRQVADQVAADEPVELEHLLVDNATMQLLLRPHSFDVIVTENLFGDILSDEASLLAGGLGALPSASLGSGQTALFEPAHGSAPDIAGTGIANPCAAILSAALLLRYALADELGARRIERAVEAAVSTGNRTPDLGGSATTVGFTDAVLTELEQHAPSP